MEKIRHSIRPEIAYTFIPEVVQDKPPEFLGGIRGQHSLTYGLTNTLLARTRGTDGKVSYREMMRLKLAQTYDIRESRREMTDPETDKHRPSAM